MTETIVSDIEKWAHRHGIEIKMESLRDKTLSFRNELDDALVDALEPIGFVSFLEQGFPPEDYLPELIKSYLSLITDAVVKLESVTTEDDWMSATAILVKDEIKTNILLEEVNQSDWIPTFLPDEMEKNSRNNCKKVLYTVCGEDPFTVVYLTQEAVNEIEQIREKLSYEE